MATTCPTQLPSGRHEASGRSTKVPAIPLPDDESSAFTEFPVFLKIARLIRSLCGPYRAPAGALYVVTTGGLASYDADRTDIFRRTASYVDRVLRGEKPGVLPFQQPIKYQLTINLKSAKALGLTIPRSLLATADEVIE